MNELLLKLYREQLFIYVHVCIDLYKYKYIYKSFVYVFAQ